MSNQSLSSHLDAPRVPTHDFILTSVVPAVARPGERTQPGVDVETSGVITTKTGALLAVHPKEVSALSSLPNVDCSEVIDAVIARAIQSCGGDDASDSVPLASYLNEVRPMRIRDGAIQTHECALARRPLARRKAAAAPGGPYRAEMFSQLTGAH